MKNMAEKSENKSLLQDQDGTSTQTYRHGKEILGQVAILIQWKDNTIRNIYSICYPHREQKRQNTINQKL